NGVSGTFYPWQVIHIRNVGIDGGYTGLSTIHYAARCLGIAQSADEQSLETFEGGSMVKGMVAGGETVVGMGAMQEEQLKTVADRIDSELRSGKNIIELPAGTTFNSLQMTVAEAKLLEHREFSVFEIARFTGVPPEKLFVNMTQNYKASEMAQINFLNDSVSPIITQIEQEFSNKLIPKALAFRENIRFEREALLKADITALADYYAKMHGMGVLTTNEIRAKKGLQPVEGGEQPLVSTNLQKLNQIKVNGPGKGNQDTKGE
ncbi:MAG: phage portal protein, partial [Tannerellaceae bacterium]